MRRYLAWVEEQRVDRRPCRRSRLIGVLVLGVVSALIPACGGGQGETGATSAHTTEPAASDGPDSDPTPLPDAPTSTASTVSFEFASETSGYTSEAQISNLAVSESITDAPPGFTEVFVEFDWEVTNTTGGRKNIMPISNLVVVFPIVSPTQNGCLTSGGSSGIGSSECRVSLDFYPTTTVPNAIGPGESRRGHYSMSVDDQVLLVPQSIDLTALKFGSVNPSCTEPCLFTADGRSS